MDLRGAGSGFDFRGGCLGPPQRDVLAHRRAQELNVLKHEADEAVKLVRRDLAERHIADGDPPRRRIPEAGQQPRHRRLAGAGRAHKRGNGAGLEHQADLPQHFRSAVVGESDPVIDHAGARRRAGRPRLGQHRRVEEPGDAARRLPGHHHVVLAVGEGEEGRRQTRRQHGEGQQVDRRGRACRDEAHAADQHHGEGKERRQHDFGGRRERDEAAHPLPEGGDEGLGTLDEAVVRAPGLTEGLDHGNALDERHRGRVDALQRAVVGGHLLAVAPVLEAVEHDSESDRRERGEGEPPVHPGEVGEGHQRRDDGRDHVRVGMTHQVVKCCDIVLERLLDCAGVAQRKPAERHPTQVRGHALAQVELEVDIGQVREQAGGEQEDELHEKRAGAEAGDRPGPPRIGRPLGQQHAGELGDRNEGPHPGRGAHGLQQAGQDQHAADRPNEPSQGWLGLCAHAPVPAPIPLVWQRQWPRGRAKSIRTRRIRISSSAVAFRPLANRMAKASLSSRCGLGHPPQLQPCCAAASAKRLTIDANAT